MKKILVIGSAVADVIIRLEDHLPVKGEDVHVLSQEMRLGGCAYNVFDAARHLDKNVIPFFPIGSGPYADFVAGEFSRRGIVSAAPRPTEANGCCYCFIEADGERTFVVYHGAEYRFKKEWFESLDTSDIDMCYVCGLEVEETTGPVVVSFLEVNPHIQVFFAPGPRIRKIDPSLLKRMLALRPILHLNDMEAEACAELFACQKQDMLNSSDDPFIPDHLKTGNAAATLSRQDRQTAARQIHEAIYSVTHRPVIITLGKQGSTWFDGKEYGLVSARRAQQIDTVGAGDAHAGACLALLHQGKPLPEALDLANRLAAMVVAAPGALLDDAAYAKLTAAGI